MRNQQTTAGYEPFTGEYYIRPSSDVLVKDTIIFKVLGYKVKWGMPVYMLSRPRKMSIKQISLDDIVSIDRQNRRIIIKEEPQDLGIGLI